MFKKLLLVAILFSCMFFTADFVLAQSGPEVGIDYAENIGLEGGGKDVRDVLVRLVQIAFGFLSLIAVLYVMYAGWLWMTSEGSEDQIGKAKKTLVNAVIGLIVMLSAFMIVTWIINNLDLGSGSGKSGNNSAKPVYNGGIGVLGACSIENVYPVPGQEEVPRNTSVIVTFKEEMDPTTICLDAVAEGGNGNGVCDAGEYVIPENVRLFKKIEKDGCPANCANNVSKMNVYSNDNKTFVFVPVDFIGSPSEYLWYEVYLSNDIRKPDGKGAFDNCKTDFADWVFQVSDKIDLTPPQVLSGGVFPATDNAFDTYSGVAALPAAGVLTFSANPEAGSDAYISGVATANGGSPAISGAVTIDPDCSESGNLLVSLPATSDGQTAELSLGSVLLGSAVFSGKSIEFPGYLSFSLNDFPAIGNSWTFSGVVARVDSDLVKVGRTTYRFVNVSTGANQIVVDPAILANTITNAITKINASSEVHAVLSATPNAIDISAEIAGVPGNSIELTTTAASITLSPTLGHLSGGTNSEEMVTINDRKDKNRNAVIQVTFNEAITPLTVSGEADAVSDYIRVTNNAVGSLSGGTACSSNQDCLSFYCAETGPSAGTCINDYLAGEFVVSNIYRTVEFVSDVLCGVNGCGEEIYCLPPNSNIRVEIEAATLDGANNCSARVPFSIAGATHCEDSSGNFYPFSDPLLMDGVFDTALNSMDGDRSDFAESKSVGLANYYNENLASGDGDSYLWSFFINDKLDLTPPVINNVFPVIGGVSVGAGDTIVIDYSKVMMSGSVRTGQKRVDTGNDEIIHHNLNAWSVGGAGFGYWTACVGVDDGPVDDEYDWSKVEIRHSNFPDTVSIKAQAGSGLRDIYQNCFKPSGDSMTCAANDSSSSCCEGSATTPAALGMDGNCP